MDKKRIEVGDAVMVYFSNQHTISGLVDHIARATGDSWVILNGVDEDPIYVQSFNYIALTRKADETKP